MAWAVTADPERFEEALDWFKKRFPVTEELLEALGQYAGARAWTVADVAELDVVLDVFKELELAIAEGRTLAEFKKAIGAKLTKSWGKSNAARIETIYRTNMQTAYNAGRWKQLTDPDIVRTRPYLMYDAILDSRTSDICKKRNGTVLPASDPWWSQNNPPLHHRCRSSLRALRPREAERQGIDDSPPEADNPSPGFGQAPGLDAPFEPDPAKYPRELFDAYAQKRTAATERRQT